MKTFKQYTKLDERQMNTPQKVAQMQHYWDDLSHMATDDQKKKKMEMKFGIKNIKLDPRKGKILSFELVEEAKQGHALVVDGEVVARGSKSQLLKKVKKDGIKIDHKKNFLTLTGKEVGDSWDEERDYKDEYKKFQSSTEKKKYRAELNKYNRQKGTYGNKDKKDASHKDGKIVGFEDESINRGRREKSRLKVDEKVEYYLDTSKDDTTKYVATDGDYWYTGKVGMKGGSAFLKFAATRISRSYFEDAKLKKASPKEIEKDALKKPSIISTVDFKKLYKK